MRKIKFSAMACLMFVALVLTGLSGCNDVKKDDSQFSEINMNQIIYEQTKANQVRGSGVNLILPGENLYVGNTVTASCYLDFAIDSYIYYLVDWGDGMWNYNGPYAYSSNHKAIGEVRHIYRKAGSYKVKAVAFNLSDGTKYGWSLEQTLVISEGQNNNNIIKKVKPISSNDYSDEYKAVNITDDNTDTYWQSKTSGIVEEQFIGYLFNDYYTLNILEVKIPDELNVFPSNISIEYTTDGGVTWYGLPRYYYVYPYSVGRYGILMNFPNPKGATLQFLLDGIVANGIRLTSKMFPFSTPFEKVLGVSEMRVYADSEKLLYTSDGGMKDADLNNMWTIYGNAKTENSMYSSLRGGATNQDPFRSGMAMIASTEWFEWNGLKSVWTDYSEVKSIHEQALVDARYGGDGWYYDETKQKYVVDKDDYDNSTSDGYIWATSTAPQHLGVQNHYTNNSAFIIAARDYLMWGNGTEGFFDLKNSQGQTMYDKLTKAAEYMLETLDGKNGIMTIFDPRNAATPGSNASNYWDNYDMCGYQSAYENTLFYCAIKGMADVEGFKGNEIKHAYYENICEKIKTEFNNLFWDSNKKRYITSVDAQGKKIDFGITFINFYAVKYGLANDAQAKAIYEWMDGERIIEGDTSTGADIYHFTVSARSNTLDIASDGPPYYWWNHNGALPIGKGTWGEFGNVMQNGGTIFYISYYDIMGRLQVSPDNAFGRFSVILNEFHKDELRRYTYTEKGGYQMGLLGEFPESGLVPYTFISGFLGINPTLDGLSIKANLPSELSYGGINSYYFGGREYSIEVSKNVTSPEIYKKGDKYILKLKADKEYIVTLDNRLITK